MSPFTSSTKHSWQEVAPPAWLLVSYLSSEGVGAEGTVDELHAASMVVHTIQVSQSQTAA